MFRRQRLRDNPMRLLLAALLALTLAACGDDSPRRDAPGGPALWRVERGALSAYVFGTVHVLPKDFRWRTATLDKAVGESDRLVLEASGLDEDKAGTIFAEMGTTPGLPQIEQRVPPHQRAALAAIMQRGSLDSATLTSFESWAAGMLLSSVTQQSLGLHDGSGVEPALTADFRKADKPVEGLESIAHQFSAFDRLPEKAQRQFLTYTIADDANAKAQYAVLLKAWESGDTDTIASEFEKEVAPQPALRGPLLTDRNRAWAARIVTMKGKPFIAVGAGHLAGADNLLSLLEHRGFTVTRVQ